MARPSHTGLPAATHFAARPLAWQAQAGAPRDARSGRRVGVCMKLRSFGNVPGMTAIRGGDEDAYQCLVSHLDNPMFIVTVASDRERAGCLVGFATQCSQHPPRWYVGISKLNHTFAVAATSGVAVVHSLGVDNVELARLFGEQTGDDVDKFARCEWRPGPDGRTPVLRDCPRWFAGQVVDRVDPGDHLGLVLAPYVAECQDHGPQLGLQALPPFEPGHPS